MKTDLSNLPASKQRRGLRAARIAFGLACFAASAVTSIAAAADLTINLTNIERSEGKMQIAIYGSEADYRKTLARGIQQPATSGKMTIVVKGLPEGEYAVLVYQDLDGNGKLDTNMLGIPKEPWGGSVQGKSVMGAPGWNDAKFRLPAGGLAVEIGL